MGGIINAIDISGEGLSVQRARMNVIAQNMANAETVETDEGGPYQRKRVIVSENESAESFNSELAKANTRLARTHEGHRPGRVRILSEKTELSGVEAQEVTDPESSFRLVYDPSHPKADDEGYVKMPDVNVIDEMVDMMAASRAYEANTAVISAAKKMANDALDI
jgi:flagellar basal-body rod protein FlgC